MIYITLNDVVIDWDHKADTTVGFVTIVEGVTVVIHLLYL